MARNAKLIPLLKFQLLLCLLLTRDYVATFGTKCQNVKVGPFIKAPRFVPAVLHEPIMNSEKVTIHYLNHAFPTYIRGGDSA